MPPSPATSIKVIMAVVITIAAIAIICTCSLCLGMFIHIYADAAVTTAVIAANAAAMGALGGLLVNTRSNPPAGTASESTTTITQTPAATTTVTQTPAPETVPVKSITPPTP